MYKNEQINKQKESTSKKEVITCNRPIHIAHYSHSHLGLCREHFAVASTITMSRIKAGFAVFSFVYLAI